MRLHARSAIEVVPHGRERDRAEHCCLGKRFRSRVAGWHRSQRARKGLAEARLRSLHPLPEGKNHYSTDFEKRLRKIFEKQSADCLQPWLSFGVLAAGN